MNIQRCFSPGFIKIVIVILKKGNKFSKLLVGIQYTEVEKIAPMDSRLFQSFNNFKVKKNNFMIIKIISCHKIFS